MNDGEYVTEGSYATPLPRTDVERHLWRLVMAIHKAVSARTFSRTADGRLRHGTPSAEGCGGGGGATHTSACLTGDDDCDPSPMLKPLRLYLESLTVDRAVQRVGGSVVDLVVQLPHAAVRRDALRLALSFPKWCFDLCGPVAVAASRGDVASIKTLMRDRRLDPNCGFPLTLAVRHHQLEALRVLLTSRHIRPNHGSAFFEAVSRRDMACLTALVRHAHLNPNRFAKNRGTTPLQHAVRGYMTEVAADGSSVRSGPEANQCELARLHASPAPSPSTTESDERHFSQYATSVGSQRSGSPVPCGGGLAPGGSTPKPARIHCVPVSPQGTCISVARASAAAAKPSSPPSSETPVPLNGPPDRPQPLSSRTVDSDSPLESARSPRSSRGRPRTTWWTPASWTEVLTFLLHRPNVDVNAGFHATPLMTAVVAQHASLTELLLTSVLIKPNRVTPSARGLSAVMHFVKRTGGSGVTDTVALLTRTPLEAALEMRSLRCFELLVRDRRVHVPQLVWQKLEQSPTAEWVIPFLEILARYRPQWESWAWRWRRVCLVTAQVCAAVLTVLHWFFLTTWSAEFGRWHSLCAGFATALMVPVGVWCLLRRRMPCSTLIRSPTADIPSSNALITTIVGTAPRCGLPPSACRWALWFSLVCAPLLPVWPLYSAWLTLRLGWATRGPWRRPDQQGDSGHRGGTRHTSGDVTTTVVVVDGHESAGGDACADHGPSAQTNVDDDALSTTSNTTTASMSTTTSVSTTRPGDDSSLSVTSAPLPGASRGALGTASDRSWGSAHLLHAVRRLSHHHSHSGQDSDASHATQCSQVESTADDDGENATTRSVNGSQFILSHATAVPCVPLRAALYGLYSRLVFPNVVISVLSFVVHINFLFPARVTKSGAPTVEDAHNRFLLILLGFACFACSLIELTALLTSWLSLQNATPSSLLSASTRTDGRRHLVNAQPILRP